jgi:AraC family transcriptional regulator of adaptative response/methylated-DNA-[protein]-cysteine methyltransferase
MTAPALPHPDEMYRALLARDASYEGTFWLGVRTTGIVCRPTCPARKPKRENVAFFASLDSAIEAGFRPCLRCRPTEHAGTAPEWAASLLHRLHKAPQQRMRDTDLRTLGLDPMRVRRWFVRVHGTTFHGYQRALRLGRAMHQLQGGTSVLATTFDAAYESPTAFREAFSELFGVLPGEVGPTSAAPLIARQVATPLGAMLAIANDDGLCLLEFADRPMLATQLRRIRQRFSAPIIGGSHALLDQVERELEEYFAGERTEFTVPLRIQGTEFQRAAWDALRNIPYGTTLSYGEQAHRIGRADAQRAIGRANGDNCMAIIIPCHRVVRADGTLCGYGGGLWRKQRLLELESLVVSR